MTFIPVSQAARQLGIDAKTLHRWLTHAQLALHAHPTDARLKGLSDEQLQQLASAHHRSLIPLPEERPAPAPTEPPAVPKDLLALLATLSSLPSQLAALQQQLTALTQLIQPPAGLSLAGPVVAAEPAVIPAVLRTPKPPAKPAHVLARVEYVGEGHYVVLCPTHGLLPFEPESPQWFAWLATRGSFRFVGQRGRFTAHREGDRLPNAVWRAHRKVRNHTYNLRLAHTPTLTISVLEQAAATLQAHLT